MIKMMCCLCGKECEDRYGNNPEPLMRNSEINRCCNECNDTMVIPARMYNIAQGQPARQKVLFTKDELKKLINYIDNNDRM